MKILKLNAENFKRLGVVEITPQGSVVKIGGNNGEGKSSVLDAIYVALKGRAVAPPKPIRKGEEKAIIRLDMGDLVVTRAFHEQDGKDFTDTIKVENADGLRYSKPQEVLNALLGEVGFDPFAFVGLKRDEQAQRLLEMVPLSIDLDEFAQQDQSDYANRRDINREVERLRAQVAGIPEEEVPAEAPDRNVLADQLANAADTNAGIERERARREDLKRQADNCSELAANARRRAAELRAEAEKADAAAVQQDEARQELIDQIESAKPLPGLVDTAALRTQLSEAEAVLAAIDRQSRRAKLAEELKAAEEQSEGYTKAMAERAALRNKALAEAELPVPGLAFALDERGKPVLTYEGLPFEKDQISTAVQLRVSTAIGMAANPRLRVLRISDGSLLDENSMKMLTEMAEAEDFQLWIEVVGEGGVGVVMENGEVKGAADPAEEAKLDAAEAGDLAGTGGGTAAKPKKAAKPKDGEKLL